MRGIILLHLLATALFMPGVAWCGKGTYTDGDVDRIVLNARFFYEETDIASWEPLFREASRRLFDATQGQAKISEVYFYKKCRGTKDKSDVWIFKKTKGRAFSTGRLGAPGYIGLYGNHRQITQESRGDVGLAHEMGHYVFGLLDEYLNKNGQAAGAQGCTRPPHTPPDAASLMSAGTAAINHRTEFCVASNHNRGRTEQDKRRKIGSQIRENVDSWTWLVAFAKFYYGVTLNPPDDEPTSGLEGFGEDPVFLTPACGVRLSVSARGSANTGAVKAGIEKLISLLEESDTAGLVFSSPAVDIVPMQPMNKENRTRALSEVAKFGSSASGDWASLLSESVRQISGGTDGAAPVAQEVILLISDGAEGPEAAPAALLSPIDNRGVTVYTIAVGNTFTPGVIGLQRIAADSGGAHLSARTAADLDAAALATLAAIKGRGIIEANEGKITAENSLQPIEVPIDVMTAEKAADFLLTWSGPGEPLEMKVVGPDGAEAIAGPPQGEPDQQVRRYLLSSPKPGRWRVIISNPGSAPRDYAFQVHSLEDDVTVSGYADQEVVTAGTPVLLKALVALEHPVTGVKLAARIERPDGTMREVTLRDDGSMENSDDRAGDGTYSGEFKDYSGNGSYSVEIFVDSTGGVEVSPGEPGETFTPEPVPSFVRKDRFSFVVTGAPN